MVKKRILCAGDSLTLPRNGIPYESTWVCLLQQLLSDYSIINRSQRAMTTANINGSTQGDFLEFYNPEIVIIQLGIVDCAPRYLKNGSIVLKLINSAPATVANSFWKVFKKYRNRKKNFADVMPVQFRKNLIKYLDRCVVNGVNKVIIIAIGIPGSEMIRQTPLIVDQVKTYNDIYRDLSLKYGIIKLIDPLSEGRDEYFIGDGYHIGFEGAKKITTELFAAIKSSGGL